MMCKAFYLAAVQKECIPRYSCLALYILMQPVALCPCCFEYLRSLEKPKKGGLTNTV